MERQFTIVASGGVAKRQALLNVLDKSGLADISEQWELNPSHGLPRDKEGWITVYTDDVPGCLQIIEAHKWRSRMQWDTPHCPRCRTGCEHCAGSGRSNDHRPAPQPDVLAELAELKRRLAQLEGVA